MKIKDNLIMYSHTIFLLVRILDNQNLFQK